MSKVLLRIVCFFFGHEPTGRSVHVKGHEPGTGYWKRQCARCEGWVRGGWR